MKRILIGCLLCALLASGLTACNSRPIDAATPSKTTTTTVTTTATTTTTTSKTQATNKENDAQILRLTVLTPYLTAMTDGGSKAYHELITLAVDDYAPGTILEVEYDGRLMESFPAKINAFSIFDTGELDEALRLIKGKIIGGNSKQGYTFRPEDGSNSLRFINHVQGLPVGATGTLCLYGGEIESGMPEGYLYADK